MPFLDTSTDSDTPTSSSENESIASVSTPAISPSQDADPNLIARLDLESDSDSDPPVPRPSKWDADAPPALPHRVLKLRRLLFEAFHSSLTILHETRPHAVTAPGEAGKNGRPKKKGEAESVKLDVKEPWMRLSRTVGALKSAAGALKDGDRACRLCFGELSRERWLIVAALHTIISSSVLPLTTDKQYIRKLARNEAKAIPSLLKSWSKIPSASGEDGLMGQAEALQEALDSAGLIVLRLADHALSGTPGDGLDLSSLGIPPSALDNLDIPSLCDLLGVMRSDIKRLDLSLNGWKRLPAWLPFPFSSVTSLDLTNNVPLRHLPISLLHLSVAHIHIRGTQLGACHAPIIRSIPAFPAPPHPQTSSNPPRRLGGSKPTETERSRPTLVHILLRLYMTILRPHYPPSTLAELPPHILHLLSETYKCELCLEYQYPDAPHWLEHEVERGWMAVEAEQKVVRVKGRVCAACDASYLPPKLSRST